MEKRRIIITEEIEPLDQIGESKVAATTEMIERLYTILSPAQVERLVERMEEARITKREVVVGVRFTFGKPVQLVITDSEYLPKPD
jgi:DNA-binding MurR/RpiR family transcriptional regulator